MKKEREFNYKATISKEGVFNTKIRNKMLVKQLDAICLLTDQNKTKYVENAIQIQIEKDLKNIRGNEVK